MITGRAIGAGDLREPITIQSATDARTGTGAVTTTWATILTTRAKVEPIRGNELARMAQTQAQSDYRVTIRDQATAVKPQYQVVWSGKTLDINSVIPIGAESRWLELLCKERFDSGG